MERTLIIIKPDAYVSGKIGLIIDALEKIQNFLIVDMKMKRITIKEAEELYVEHKDKEYYSEQIHSIVFGQTRFNYFRRRICC